MTLAFTIEITVAVLLAVTIGYCAILNRKLSIFRDNYHCLKTSAGEIVKALELTGKSAKELKKTVLVWERHLSDKLEDSREISFELHEKIIKAQDLIEALQSHEATPVSNQTATLNDNDLKIHDGSPNSSDTNMIPANASVRIDRLRKHIQLAINNEVA